MWRGLVKSSIRVRVDIIGHARIKYVGLKWPINSTHIVGHMQSEMVARRCIVARRFATTSQIIIALQLARGVLIPICCENLAPLSTEQQCGGGGAGSSSNIIVV